MLRWTDWLKNDTMIGSIDTTVYGGTVKDNPHDALHMSVQSYLACEDTPENARLFLWHSLGVNEEFTGTGYTKEPDGSQGVEEYLLPNCTLAELPDYRLIELAVSLDSL